MGLLLFIFFVRMASSMQVIQAGTYKVFIGEQVFAELGRMLSYGPFKHSRIFILADEHSLQYCYPLLAERVKRVREAEIIEIESGEHNKNMDVCRNIWETLSELGADRHSLLINIGGGVIGDMGGFAAATFKRGISFIHVPTTLLSQVDASVGGKLGVDLNNLKNEIGVFGDPAAVFIYPGFLKTLTGRQLLSGFAEVVKHALIADVKYWNYLRTLKIQELDTVAWQKIILRSVEIKKNIVKKDPKEKGIRKALNFGHTIGHAIETYSLEGGEIQLFHGEAVAIGIVCELYLSSLKSKLDKSLLSEISSFILHTFRSATLQRFDDTRLVELMRHDKKNKNGKISFTLLSGIGKVQVDKTCSIEEIKKALNYYREQLKLTHLAL